jgi:DNA modification methylase
MTRPIKGPARGQWRLGRALGREIRYMRAAKAKPLWVATTRALWGLPAMGKKSYPEAWELWKLDRIKPHPKNERLHSPEQISLLASIIKKWGPDQPIVVDEDGTILKGHARLAAALEIGLSEFPVVQRFGMSETDKTAMRISDNQITLAATWSNQLLTHSLAELKLSGYDMPLLAFSEVQLRGFGIALGTESEADPEDVPEPPKKPVVRRGDLWLLGGDHRIFCGDATSESDVAMCIGDAKPNLMVTDPPYGVEYDPNWRNSAKRSNGRAVGATALGKVSNDDRSDWTEAWKLFSGDVAYVWHADKGSHSVTTSLLAADFQLRAQIIWAKNRTIIGRGDYHYNHEPCWYAVRKGKTGHWNGGRQQGTLWPIDHDPNTTGHGTQKPIECMKRPIENNSRAGDFVYEPFAGSGTTIIACEMTGRKALAIEIDPGYVQVCTPRLATATEPPGDAA